MPHPAHLGHIFACTLLGKISHLAGLEAAYRRCDCFRTISRKSSHSSRGILRCGRRGQCIPPLYPRVLFPSGRRNNACLAVAMLGSRESPAIYATLPPIIGGVAIAAGFEPSFHLVGCIYSFAATSARAFKSVLQGILLADSADRIDSQAFLRRVGSWAAVMLLPATLILEPGAITSTARACRADPALTAFLAVNAILSYVVNLTNFLVTKQTSPLTLQVLGNAKGLFATAVSGAFFHNPVSSAGMTRYGIAVLGAFGYASLKKKTLR